MRGKQLLGIKGLFCAIFFFCCTSPIFATPVIVSLTEVKGTCVSNCGIIINAINLGTNVKYGLINYPTVGQTRTQNTNEFTNLEPGTYTVGVYDNTTGDSPITQEITITTSYIEMFMSEPVVGNGTSSTAICDYNGTITISFTGGTAPFRYKIDGPVTKEETGQSGRSLTFTGLPSGNYTVEVEDACGQWRRNKPESPVVVTSSGTYKDNTFTNFSVSTAGNTFFYANRDVCDELYYFRLYYTNGIITLSNGSTLYVNDNSALEYYLESPAHSNNWVGPVYGNSTLIYFYNIPFDNSDRTYRLKVLHPCTGEPTYTPVYNYPNDPVFTTSQTLTYTDFCTLSDASYVSVYLQNSSYSYIRNYGCGTYRYVLKKSDGTVLNDQTLTTSIITYSRATYELIPEQTYTVDIYKNNSATITQTVTFKVNSVAAKKTTYYHTNNTNYAPGYNFGTSCDFDHTRLWAYRSITSLSSSGVKYTILSGPDGFDINDENFKPKTTTSYSSAIWDNLPYGEYTIREEWQGCEYFDVPVSVTKPYNRFVAGDLEATEDKVCGMFTIRGQGYFENVNGTRYSSSSNNATRYYMQIVEGPSRSDGTPTVGLRSSIVYCYNSSSDAYKASISNLPGGKYKVIFYSYYTPVTYTGSGTNLRYNVPTCHYVEKEIEVVPYILPKLNIPMSGGISCSPTGGQATLTINGKGDENKKPFLYRFKEKDASDDTYFPANFSETNVYHNLNAGEYTVQILDQCGNIGTQDVTIFNSGDQIIEIIGGVDDGSGNTVICKGQPVTFQVKSIGPVDSYKWSRSNSIAGPWSDLTDAGDHYFYKIENVQSGDEGYYRVTIDNTSCIINSSVHVLGVSEPAPTPSITGPTAVCLGTTFKLEAQTTVSPVASYQWYRDGAYVEGVSGNTLTTNNTGSYTVVIVPPVGCPSNQSAPHVVVSDPNSCVEASDDMFEMSACEVGYINVLENDKTASCPVNITIVTGPSNGVAVPTIHEGVNKIKYTPKATFTGVDEFTYKIACGSNESNTATVSIHVKSSIMVEVVDDVNHHASEPSEKGKFTIRFTCSGVKYSKALNVTYTVEPTNAVSGTDFVPLTGTIQIPANTPSVSLEVEPKNNYVVEGNNRTVKVTIIGVTEAP